MRILYLQFLLSLVLLACSKHRHGDPPVVRHIRFEESTDGIRWVRGTSDFHLRQAIQQASTPWGRGLFPWIDAVSLDTAQLAEDAWRVEVWYAHHGFFDARFQGWELRPLKWHGDGSPKEVEVVGHVREGRPSTVRDILLLGIEGMGTYSQRLLRRASVEEGERFSLDDHRSTVSDLQAFLWDQGFAHARVEGSVDVYPAMAAVDVTYTISGVGPEYVCRFGEILLEDTAGVPDELIHQALQFEPGDVYSAKKINESQVRVFSLGAFSVVRLIPDLKADSREIPVRIHLAAAKNREVKLGAGLGLESGEQQIRGRTAFRHANWLGKLWTLDASVFAGLKSFGVLQNWEEESSSDFNSWGPFALAEGTLGIPGPFGDGSLFRQGLEVERGLEEASRFFRWSLRPSLSFALSEYLSFTTAYRYEHWVGDLDSDLLSVEGLEALLEDYRVSALEQGLLFDFRDSKIRTRRGLYAEAKFSQAGIAAGFRFWKAEADVRRYWSLRRASGVLSARIGGGVTRPHNWWGDNSDDAYVPYAERFLLGGTNSVRGWQSDHLGPLLCEESGACVPRGALATLFGSLQWRVDGSLPFSPVFFTDLGMAWGDASEVAWKELQPSVGLGIRYDTAIGPLRLDWAWRTRDTQEFRNQPRWALHAGLGEVF